MPADSNVGYKHPPVTAQFKPGRSGNPKGRPKGRPNVANLTKAMFNEPVPVRQGGKTRQMPTCEAVVRVLVAKAGQGDAPSLSAIMDILDMSGQTNDITDEALEKRTMHLPDSLSFEQMDLLQSEAREKDRQQCRAFAEADPKRFSTSDDGDPITITVPTAIRAGDDLATQGQFDQALAAYRCELARCKTALTAADSDKQAQDDFRRAVGRIGLLADRLLLAGEFARANEFAGEAILEGSSPFWIASKDWTKPANTIWISAIRAHARMFLGHLDAARSFYSGFQTNKRHGSTSWETAILQDFARLRAAGHSNFLMDVMEKQFADAGWTTRRGNNMYSRPVMNGEDAVFIEMNPDDIKSGDLLDKYEQPDKAAYTYIRHLEKCRAKLKLAGISAAGEANLQIAAGRVEGMARKFLGAGRSALALECAEAAIAVSPDKLELHAIRAHALMFLGRDSDAHKAFLRYRGQKIGDQPWEAAIRTGFDEQRKAGRSRQLMDVIEKDFAAGGGMSETTVANSSLGSNNGVPVPALVQSSDLHAGEMLESQGMLDEALGVYGRCLEMCAAKIAKIASGQVNIRAIEDRNVAVDKIGGLAIAFLSNQDFAKALAAAELALSALPNSPLPNICRAHALMFLGRTDEARALYLQYRGAKLSGGQSGESCILQNFNALRKAERARPLMDEVEKRFAARS